MEYQASPLERDELERERGLLVLDFGTNWCGHCGRARALVDAALAERSDARHIRIEDGPGRALGRSFKVKLWPTLVFLRDGQELARLVRPQDLETIREALRAI